MFVILKNSYGLHLDRDHFEDSNFMKRFFFFKKQQLFKRSIIDLVIVKPQISVCAVVCVC